MENTIDTEKLQNELSALLTEWQQVVDRKRSLVSSPWNDPSNPDEVEGLRRVRHGLTCYRNCIRELTEILNSHRLLPSASIQATSAK